MEAVSSPISAPIRSTAVPPGRDDPAGTGANRARRVLEVRAAYEAALRAVQPKPAELAWRLGRFDRGLRLMRELSPRVGALERGEFVDLGAAHGGDSCAAIALGMNATLADFRDHEYGILAAHVGRFARVTSSVFDVNGDWPLPIGKFDLAFAMGLLEHVRSSGGFFEKLRAILRPGGHAVVQTAMALQGIHRDPLFGTPGTSLLPMAMRRFAAERLLGRRYSCPLKSGTYYSAGPICRAAARAGLRAEAFKYADSRMMARVADWPAAGFWQWALRRYCADYVLVSRPAE